MPCYRPLHGFRSREVSKTSGKRKVVFDSRDGFVDLDVIIPCGQCIGCKLERARQWAVRCVLENKMHDESSFITLTYDSDNLPPLGSLMKKDFQDFMKRTRSALNKPLRYFMCGEYGEERSRPHYHAIMFGESFPERYRVMKNGIEYEGSKIIDKLWPLGMNVVGDVTFQSCAYVSSYVLKRITGEKALEHYAVYHPETGDYLGQRLPEYVEMSRGGNKKVGNKGGIASSWYDKWKSDVYPSGEVVVEGFTQKPPKYFDEKIKLTDRDMYDKIKVERIVKAMANELEMSYERMCQKERVVEKRKKIFGFRRYEDDC